jgi:hypothetical protein
MATSTDTDGDQHRQGRTMRANHAVFDLIFIQYIIILPAWNYPSWPRKPVSKLSTHITSPKHAQNVPNCYKRPSTFN